MANQDTKVIPVSSVPIKRTSIWPAKLRSSSGEKLKNWAAMLMGLAALVTALGTYFKPTEDPEYKTGYAVAASEITAMSKDIKDLNDDVNRLYKLRREETNRRKVAAELETSAYDIEDKILRDHLTRKYGERYSNQYMNKRKELRLQIRQEYVDTRMKRLRQFSNPPNERKLPSYGKTK